MKRLSLGATSLLALAAGAGSAFAAPCAFSTGVTGATYTYSDAIVTCTVQNSGDYSIAAYGASGGYGDGGTNAGGLGAQVGADLALTAGETLGILVGGEGQGTAGRGGGGGGSFIAYEPTPGDLTTAVPLVVGGGGGGAALNNGDSRGSTTPSGADGGIPSAPGGAGGANGNGGSGSPSGGSGGGGFYTPGTAGGSTPSDPGSAFIDGSAGGVGSVDGGYGGFGGGGAGGSSAGGSGGGGYSGGGGGPIYYGGGGGGSFLAADANNTLIIGAENLGDGEVYIIESQTVVPPTSAPEPPSLIALGTALLGLGAVLGRRRAR